MSENNDSDLYDDIICQDKENNVSDADISDLYDNIHNPLVTETALRKVQTLTSENEKLRSQNKQLKEQIHIVQDLNYQLTSKNSILENNIREVIETARVEINRKNTEIIDRQTKLEDVLFRRAARNLQSKELEAIMERFSLRGQEDSLKRLPTNLDRMRARPDPSNGGNRQIVRKRKAAAMSPEVKKEEVKRMRVEGDKDQTSVSRAQEKILNTDISIISKYVKGKDRKKKEGPRSKQEAPSEALPQETTEQEQSKDKTKTEERPLEDHQEVQQSHHDKTDERNVEDKVEEVVEACQDSVSDGYKSGDDLLEIDTTERFDDDEEESPTQGNVYFKTLETNFYIPRVVRQEKSTMSSSGDERKKERRTRSRRESSSGERPSWRRGRSTSRSRRRRQRSGSRTRRSRSRNRREIERREKTDRKRRQRSPRASSGEKRARSPRIRSGEKIKRKLMKSDSKESKTKLARRSQSLSPSRLKTDDVDIEKLEIKEDLCLSDLQRIKAKIMGQMGLNEKLEPVKDAVDVEDGELLSEDDNPDVGERTKKIKDLRQKLSRVSAVVTSSSESPIERR